MDKLTMQITGHKGAYHWRFDDAEDGAYASSQESFAEVHDAKSAIHHVLEQGLHRHREKRM